MNEWMYELAAAAEDSPCTVYNDAIQKFAVDSPSPAKVIDPSSSISDTTFAGKQQLLRMWTAGSLKTYVEEHWFSQMWDV